MQILKLFQWFQPITDNHTCHRDDVINDVVQYDYCEYGEQGLQISHAYFCFVSAFCFTSKHAETKLKQNNFTKTKHCFAFVLFQFYFSFISDVTTALHEYRLSLDDFVINITTHPCCHSHAATRHCHSHWMTLS